MSKFTVEDVCNLNTTLPMPKNPKQIIIIGAGGIVSDAHLPAYKKSGFQVAGIFDPLKEKAEKMRAEEGLNEAEIAQKLGVSGEKVALIFSLGDN